MCVHTYRDAAVVEFALTRQLVAGLAYVAEWYEYRQHSVHPLLQGQTILTRHSPCKHIQ